MARGVGRKLLALGLGFLVALALAEFLLRCLGFEFPFFPTRLQVGWPDPLILQEQYTVDRHLLWVPKDYAERLAAWRNRRPVVAFLGDSCTEFGFYDRFFERRVAAWAPAAKDAFFNVGVSGWSTFQGLHQLRRDVLPLRPAIVTFFFGWNDHWQSFGLPDKDLGAAEPRHPLALLRAFHSFRVAQLIGKVFFALGERRQERVSLEDFRANLETMVRLARDNGSIPVLLTAPSGHVRGEEPLYLTGRYLHDPAELLPLHERYVEVVRAVAAAEQAPLVDLAAVFAALPRLEREAAFKNDGIHLTESGDQIIAETLERVFLEHSALIGVLGATRVR